MFFLFKSVAYCAVMSSIGLAVYLFCARQFVRRSLGFSLAGAMLYCIGIAWLSPTVLVHLAAAALVVPLFGHKRENTAAVYVFSLLMMPGITFPLQAGGVYLFVLTNFMAVTLGSIATSLAVDRRRTNRGFTVSGLALVALFLVYFLSSARATSSTNMLRVLVEQIGSLALPYLAIRASVRTHEDLRRVLVGLVAATAALSALVIYEARVTWPLYRAVYAHYDLLLEAGNAVKLRGGLMRAPGPFPEPTSLAIWLSFGALAALTGRWMFRSRTHQVIVCGLLLAGMFAPQSRGAWLGLIVAYLIYQIGTGRFAAVAKGAAVAVFGGAIVYIAALNINQLGQMLGLNKTGEIGHDYRQDLFDRGIQEAQHHLLFGTDLGSVATALYDLRQGEGIVDFVNTYLYVLLVSGLVGLVVFLFALIAPMVTLWRKSQRLPLHARGSVSTVIALLGSLAIMIFFTSLIGRSMTGLSILLALAACLTNMPLAELAGEAGARFRPRRNLVRDSAARTMARV